MFLWLGHNLGQEFIEDVFGVGSLAQINIETCILLELDNPLSHRSPRGAAAAAAVARRTVTCFGAAAVAATTRLLGAALARLATALAATSTACTTT